MKLKYFPSVSAEEKPCFDISEDLGGGNFGYIGEVFEEANAAFIVKACNSHYQLLDALKKIASQTEDKAYPFRAIGTDQMMRIAREAIKQAEEL